MRRDNPICQRHTEGNPKLNMCVLCAFNCCDWSTPLCGAFMYSPHCPPLSCTQPLLLSVVLSSQQQQQQRRDIRQRVRHTASPLYFVRLLTHHSWCNELIFSSASPLRTTWTTAHMLTGCCCSPARHCSAQNMVLYY